MGGDCGGGPIVGGHVSREGRESCSEVCEGRAEDLGWTRPRHSKIGGKPGNRSGVSNALGLGDPAAERPGTGKNRANVKVFDAMRGPRAAILRRLMNDDTSAQWCHRVSNEVKRMAMQSFVGGNVGVERVRAQEVQCDLALFDELIKGVKGKFSVGSAQAGGQVILGIADRALSLFATSTTSM